MDDIQTSARSYHAPVPPLARPWRSRLVPMTPSKDIPAAVSAEELADLVEAVAKHSDRTAFAALFRHFAPQIKAFLIRGGSAPEQADELTQEAMVSVWRKAATFDRSKARVSTWIFTIARNLRIDELRRGGHAVGAETGDDEDSHERIADAGASPLEQVTGGMIGVDVRAALERLPQEQREILRLSFYEEQPHAAIAATLSLPLGTVKSRIRLACAHLRELLGHWQP
jgi:RNA polymerase sigma-70 factor (ECF subfamily)